MRRAYILLLLFSLLPACYSEADPSTKDAADNGNLDIPPYATTEETPTDTSGDALDDFDVTEGDSEYSGSLSFCDNRVQLRLHATLEKCVIGFEVIEDAEHLFNANRLGFQIDGVDLAFDDGCDSGFGWTFHNTALTQIKLCEETCLQVYQNAFTAVLIDIGCGDPVTITL